MSAKRKKLKKKPHYRNPDFVDPGSVAGTMRGRNKKTQAMLDELD